VVLPWRQGAYRAKWRDQRQTAPAWFRACAQGGEEMNATNSNLELRKARPIAHAPHPQKARANRSLPRQIGSLGTLYAHALAIEHEAETSYRELAAHMADCGNDTVADLFIRLAEFEGEHAFHLAKKSAGVDIPLLAPGEYAWLDCGAPVPEARAFVYRMMTPRLALQIALRAEERAKAYFEQIGAESHDAGIRKLAAEFALDEESHIAWVKDALAYLPQPFQPSEEQPVDPAIEQRT
jgi:rubrerythrin